MTRVIQVRDVPDEVHAALVEAARARGLSLTRYMQREFERLAKQAQIAQKMRRSFAGAQAEVARTVDRETILAAIHKGRGE